MPHKIRILQAWYDRVWTEGDIDVIPELLTDDAESAGVLRDIALSPDDMPDLVQAINAHMGKLEVRLTKTFEKGDWIASIIEARGHASTTGDPVSAFGQVIARFEDEKIAELYHTFDFLSFFEQLGLLPTNVLALLLAGTRLK